MIEKKSEENIEDPGAQPHLEDAQCIPDLRTHSQRAQVQLFSYLLVAHVEMTAHFEDHPHLRGQSGHFLLNEADQFLFAQFFIGDVLTFINEMLKRLNVSVLHFLMADNIEKPVPGRCIEISGKTGAYLQVFTVVPEVDEYILHHIPHLLPVRKTPEGVTVKDALISFVYFVQRSPVPRL